MFEFNAINIVILGGSILISCLVTGIVVSSISKKKYLQEGYDRGYEKCTNEGYKIFDEKVERRKESDDYKNILENNYNKGKIDGAKEALSKFTLSYQPFVDNHDSFLKHTAEAGYHMQIFYEGWPIGDPMKRITKHEEKFKEENLKYLVDNAQKAVQAIAQAASGTGMPIQIAEAVHKQIR